MSLKSNIGVAGLCALAAICQFLPAQAAEPIKVDTKDLLVSVDPTTCRWSAEVKGTPMRLNDVHFLPADDPSGWTVVSSVNNNDTSNLGSFVTVTLRGTKPGQLDFEYQVSVSKNNDDILVSLGRSNNTGKAVEIGDMDYFVSGDARLGGTTDQWISLGTMTRNRDYYDLRWVIHLVTPQMYVVNHVVRDMKTGNSLLMGHVTTLKGSSRFEVTQGWDGKTPDRMQVRGYCTYKVTMPSGKNFAGEKLLIDFNDDSLRAMAHQGDLIATAADVRLKQRRPINLEDREWVANDYSRYHGWMSGGTEANAARFFKENALMDFYWGLGGPVRGASWGVRALGGGVRGERGSVTHYPAECYLPIQTPQYGGERVIDFSNPLTIRLERERAFQSVAGNEKETGRSEEDYADWWDKWPGQYDPYMSALETWHAGATPWREVIDQKAPRMVNRSNMQPVDHSYGLIDILRDSEDADGGYETGEGASHLLTESLMGTAIRFFYNGRVFWNDGDGFHVYKYKPDYGTNGRFNYGEGKVSANFHAIAANVLFVSEAFDEKYPDNRIELLKRISPPTMDVSYPVDLFVRKPAQVWNMPVERPFGKWSVLAVFNYTSKMRGNEEHFKFSTALDARKDLRLDPDKEYLVYEFWSKTFIGSFKGTFVTRPLNPYDCDVYSIVEKQNRPALLSTSRHVRQMAFDIKDLAYEGSQRMLRGISRAVAGDPYQLRIYVPDGFAAKRVELSGGLTAKMATDAHLLTVDYTSSTGNDVEWKVFF
ncbi:MAG: hypothetical protein ABSH56_13230 [Bryobacteraceae bacterium]